MTVKLPEPTLETVKALNEEIRDFAKTIQDCEDTIARLSKELQFRVTIRNAVQDHLRGE